VFPRHTSKLRTARPEDIAAVRELHAKMSPDNLYLRFFSMSLAAAEQEARRICRVRSPVGRYLPRVLKPDQAIAAATERIHDDALTDNTRAFPAPARTEQSSHPVSM
jgi:hypothetical protein